MMLRFLLVFLFVVILVLILIASVRIGRTFGRYQMHKNPKHKLEVITVAESSVFGLLALLIAFTFSGSYQRFETRKLHLVEEAIAFDTAYKHIDLVAGKYQPILRAAIKQYFDAHLRAFANVPNLNIIHQDILLAQSLEEKVWQTTVLACEATSNQSLAQSALDAIDNMFQVAYMGQKLTRIHPPAIIFWLMLGLAVLGAFLIGYDTAENKQKRHIHTICYIILTSVTIYTIMNLEFPRVGFIQMGFFDQMLVDVRHNMDHQVS